MANETTDGVSAPGSVRIILWILIAAALAIHGARIATVRNDRTRGESPFFSANDRSRWCTVRALVDFGTYEIDRVIDRQQSIHWDTIDKVQHVGADGQLHFYSSKPPFLPTLLAGKYWLLQQATGWKLSDQPLAVARVLLLTTNLTALAVMFCCLAGWLFDRQHGSLTSIFVLTAAGFATFATTFAVTLNNHLPATAAVMAAVFLMDRVWVRKNKPQWSVYFLLGTSAAFAAANELPALGFWVACSILSLWRSGYRWLVGFMPGSLLIAIPFFLTNWIAHGEWVPAYSHRSDGPELFVIKGDFREILGRTEAVPAPIAAAFQTSREAEAFLKMREPFIAESHWMGRRGSLGRWVLRDRQGPSQWALIQKDDQQLSVHAWGNWYDYPGSYWSSVENGRSLIDRGEQSAAIYLFHCTVGHHGFLSLTPIWMLAGAGLGAWLVTGSSSRMLVWLAWAMTIMVFVFYVTREPHDRNYGGMSSCLRWAMWLIPFWLCGLAEASRRWSKRNWYWPSAIILLAASIWSAGYSWSNPWVHPWLYLPVIDR